MGVQPTYILIFYITKEFKNLIKAYIIGVITDIT